MIQTSFPDRALMGSQVARMLLEIKAVHFRPDPPYMLTSGLASPVYIDCRKLISYPRIRSACMDWIADRLALPMQYVRKKPKGFGRDARIEGDISESQRVLLVEDLTTDGGSKVSFVNAIREAGAVCDHTIVVFYYDIFPDVPGKLAEQGIKLHYLATWRDVLAEARRGGYFETATMDEVERFLDQPLEWSAAHGGKGEISI
jgi:orotate phosphoribosyltransferase